MLLTMVWMSNTQCSVNGADDSVDVEDTYSARGRCGRDRMVVWL